MKTLTTVLVILVALPATALGFYYPFGADAPAWSQITNSATATYTNRGDNEATTTAAKTNDVDRIWGLQSITNVSDTPYINQQIAPAGATYFRFMICNAGNSNTQLTITNLLTLYEKSSVNWATNQALAELL